MKSITLTVCFLLLSPLSWALDNDNPSSPNETEQATVSYQFAIYLIPDCGKDPAKIVAEKQAKTLLPNFSLTASVSDPATSPALNIKVIDNVQSEYSPPDEQMLHYFGRGIGVNESQKLQKSTHAILLNFSYPADYALSGMYEALLFTEAVAETCEGLIWDESTREIFSPDAWHKKRIASWGKDGPSIINHTVIHAYKNTEFIRAISLGMQKFNLPDLVVNDFVWSNNDQMANLINIIGQSFIEGRSADEQLVLKVNLHDLKNEALKKTILSSLKPNATAQAIIPLKLAKHEEGDPDNVLLEINFDSQQGKSLQEKQATFISRFFGSEDKITYIKHDEEIKTASAAAKKKLPQLKRDFNQGLKPGEYIYVKAPFRTPEDTDEWMWIEVIGWGETIKGILQNEPFNVPTLRAGAEVHVTQDKIFDYIRNYPDGTSEGNETGKLIQALDDAAKGAE